jgi:hypothetical protein
MVLVEECWVDVEGGKVTNTVVTSGGKIIIMVW